MRLLYRSMDVFSVIRPTKLECPVFLACRKGYSLLVWGRRLWSAQSKSLIWWRRGRVWTTTLFRWAHVLILSSSCYKILLNCLLLKHWRGLKAPKQLPKPFSASCSISACWRDEHERLQQQVSLNLPYGRPPLPCNSAQCDLIFSWFSGFSSLSQICTRKVYCFHGRVSTSGGYLWL